MAQEKTRPHPNTPRAKFAIGAGIMLATVSLPMLGASIAGQGWRARLEFPPPLEIPSDYPRWSWSAAALVLGVLAAITLPWVHGRRRAKVAGCITARVLPAAWPWWAAVAFAWTLAWWLLAWTRFAWFAPLQRYTFFPLWLGFIVSVNALVVRRTGTCFLQRQPRRWLVLFAASTGFWWVFEWLNRFVENWHYLGVQDLGPLAYVVHASLCFSTVLPAVAAAYEWLASFPSFARHSRHGPAWTWLARRSTGAALIGLATLALLFAGAVPRQGYAAVWAAPVVLAFGAGIVACQPGLWSELAAGDWQRAVAWATAALVCGFFWELWNIFSAAKWIYTVPYVDRWHVFEMPLLGYAGYLGFGLECALVVEWANGSEVTATRDRLLDEK